MIERLSDLPGVPAEEDLCVRAARLLAADARGVPGVAVEVRKRLPLQGGLGGGSSDAATVLVALNELWGLQRPPEALAALGLALGADVPVFVHGSAAWAEGVGERLTPLGALPEPVFVLGRPDVAVSTADVFKAPELTRDSPAITIRWYLYPTTDSTTTYWYGSALWDFSVEQAVDDSVKISGNFKAASAVTKIG